MAPRSLLALLCVTPVFLGACASFGRPDVVAVVLAGEVDRDAILRARPFTAVDLTDAYLLLTADNLAGMLDLAAPEHWPAAAREAWTTGAAACRARAVRPPWGESAEARSCAAELGPSVLHRLARARGAALLIVATPAPGTATWRVVAQTPGINDARVATGTRDDLGALVDELRAGGGRPKFTREPSLPEPVPAGDDLTTGGYYQPFDVVAVAGCIRPMPVAIDVAPADVPMTNMIEHAWSTLSATVRTSPSTTCRLRAVQRRRDGARVLEGALDCEGMALVKKQRAVASVVANGDLANLAKDLVDQLAFDTCKMHPL